MTKHTLTIQLRTITGRKVKSLRRQGLIPGHIFGHNLPTVNVQVAVRDLQSAHKLVGESSLLYLQLAGETTSHPVFITSLAVDGVTSQPLQVSFHQVDLSQKVTAPVSIDLVGESPAVRDHVGVLVQLLNAIDIEALPADMPEHLEVDISSLSEVGNSIAVSDLKVAATLTVQTDPEAMIVKIEPLAKEEVVEVAPAAVIAEGEPAPEATPSSDQPATPSESKP